MVFDLDQTLIDSCAAAPHRDRRDWTGARRAVAACRAYPGILDAVTWMREQGWRVAVVSNAPETYCRAALAHLGLAVDALVAWHDTPLHKPHPAPLQLALRRTEGDAARSMAVGDSVDDARAARAAGMQAVGALWGADDPDALRTATAPLCFAAPQDFRTWLRQAA